MPGATARDYHIDTFLTNILIGYRPVGLIADQIFPVVPVKKQSDVIPIVDRANWLRIDDTKRAPATKAKEGTFSVSSITYFCKNYAFAHVTPYEVLANADAPHQPTQRAGEFVIDRLMLDFEKRVADTLAGGVGSSTTLTGTDIWSDFANSDPLTQIEIKYNAIKDTTGYVPNVCVIGRKSWQKTRRHPDIVRAAAGLGTAGVGGVVTQEQFANLIGVEKVLVPGAVINTANEGATATYADIWSASMFVLAYVAPTPGLMVPTFGYGFNWVVPGVSTGGGPGAFTLERKRDDDIGAEFVRSAYYQDEKIIAAELGAMIHTGITS
jgi:hypothetical protein